MIRIGRLGAALGVVALLAFGGLAVAAAVSNVGTGALATSSTAKSVDGLTYAVNTGVYGTGGAWAGAVVLGSASKPADGFQAGATAVTFPDSRTAQVVFQGRTADGRPVLGTETVTVADSSKHTGKISVLATVGSTVVTLVDQACTTNVITPKGTPEPQPAPPQ